MSCIDIQLLVSQTIGLEKTKEIVVLLRVKNMSYIHVGQHRLQYP